MPTISLTISGKVQGVFFRQSTRDFAISLGLTGFVENKTGGDVYIVATGPKEKLDHLIAWSRQGPPKALINNVTVAQLPDQVFESFTIRR